MRREFITEEELWRKLRQHGIESLAQVKSVHLEGDGEFSIIKREP
jgi:uncharacterized membrane protein YcaP (DUF421 family)